MGSCDLHVVCTWLMRRLLCSAGAIIGCFEACLIAHFAFFPSFSFKDALGIVAPAACTFASCATQADGLIVAEVDVFRGCWALLGVHVCCGTRCVKLRVGLL